MISKTKVNLFNTINNIEENPLHKDISGIHYSSESTFENSELENHIINEHLSNSNVIY